MTPENMGEIMEIVFPICIGLYFVSSYMAAYYSGKVDAGTEHIKRLTELISGHRSPGK